METIPTTIRKELQHAEHKNPGAVVGLADASGYIKYMSESFKEVTGHSPQEAVGRHFLDFFHEPDSSHMAIAMQDTLLNGRSVMVTRDVKLRAGGTRRMRGDAWKLTDNKTGRIYVLSVSRPLESEGRS